LAQRLVPGFDIDLLEQHLHAMRRRSQARLGSTAISRGQRMFPKMSPRNPGKIWLLGSHDGSCEQNSVIGLYSVAHLQDGKRGRFANSLSSTWVQLSSFRNQNNCG